MLGIQEKLENGNMGVGISFTELKPDPSPNLICIIDAKSINEKNQKDIGKYLAISA